MTPPLHFKVKKNAELNISVRNNSDTKTAEI